jgi:F0F1-type ATP synthase membrane subunit b/b'
MANDKAGRGLGVDAGGGPVVDPTANVQALSEASNKRQDDLREAERRYNDLRDTHQKEMADLRAGYDLQLRDAEAKRIDAIRAVDVQAAAIERERSNQTASVLANQVTASKDTLQTLVATTADQLAKNVINPLADRVAALEKSERFIGGRDVQRDVGKTDFKSLIGWALAIPGIIYIMANLLK